MLSALRYLLWSLDIVIEAAIPTPAPPPQNPAIIPPIHCRYVDTAREWDTYPYEGVIKVDVDPDDLIGRSKLQARVFTAKYVKEIETPVSVAIATTPSRCRIFQSRVVPYDPTLTNPSIYVGRLDSSELRCVNSQLADTDCILVVEQHGNTNGLVRIDDEFVDAYFANAYYFTIAVPKGIKCATGTEKTDLAEAVPGKQTNREIAAKTKASRIARRKIAELDAAKQSCIDDVKHTAEVPDSTETLLAGAREELRPPQ